MSDERKRDEFKDIQERRSCNYTWLGSPKFMNQIRVLEDIDFLIKTNQELTEQLRVAVEKLEVFENRRKLANSLRNKNPHVACFVESIGVEMDKMQKLKGGA